MARRFGSRYAAEFDLDYTRTPLQFTQAALDGVKSWEPDWDEVAVSLTADIARWHKVTDSE